MMQKIINLGAEKICIQSCFFKNKEIVKEIINHLGSQSVVLSIDIKKNFLEIIKFGIIKLKNFIKIIV